LGVSVDTYQVTLHVYVLMDNHFHLVVETPRANLSAFMRHLNVSYTGYFNRRYKRVGHLYQGRFKAIVVEAENYLTELSRYVHLNPIRLARVRQRSAEEKLRLLERYRWSSLGGYLHKQKRSPLVEYRLVLAGFGGDTERGRQRYGRFIAEGVREQLLSPWAHLQGQMLLGSEAFVEQMRTRVRSPQEPVREQPARRALAQPWEMDALIARVARELGKGVQEICARGGGLERAMVMECLYRYTAASQAAIGQQMGGVDYSWVSRQRKVLREAMARDRGAKEQFERLQHVLLTPR
jgi:REP element-mobilizing transposase RayT